MLRLHLCRVEAVDGRRFIDLHNGAGAVLPTPR